jgi:protein-S-isoprenylcysteine O-methyltransferase Ste14
MTEATGIFIACCWAGWLIYWLVMAVSTKRTLERGGFFEYRIVGGILILALLGAGRILHISAQSHAWRTTLALGVLTDCMVLAGLAFTVWARITLGRNWSSEVTFKEGHELIESGPYALVRHPIYTGLLLMALGTAVNSGRAISLAALIAVYGAIWWKARQEEGIMSRHFPDSYPEYRRRVRAIIPFVL